MTNHINCSKYNYAVRFLGVLLKPRVFLSVSLSISFIISLSVIVVSGVISEVQAREYRTASDMQVTIVPRYKPKPGISESLPAIHNLPRTLVTQKRSPDKKYSAQIMVAKPGPVYYLTIVDHQRSRRFYVDEHLITGSEYRYKDIRMFWKSVNTVIIEARHHLGKKVLWLEYNHKTARITRGERPVPDKPKPRKKLLPESLTTIRLDTLDERMMLHTQIPIGVSYAALKENMPDLGPQKKYVGKELTQAFLDIDVMGRPAKVKFNFKNKILYNFIYSLPTMKPEQAKVEYKKLQDFYSKHFGKYKENYLKEEPGYAVRQSHWKTDKGIADVVNNITHVGVGISWSVEF